MKFIGMTTVLCALLSPALAAPPLGLGGIHDARDSTLPALPSAPPPVIPSRSVPGAYQLFRLDEQGQLSTITPAQVLKDDPIIATTPEPLPECPPEAPIRLDPTMCINEAALEILNSGGSLEIADDGQSAVYYIPGEFDYLAGGYAYDPATVPCNPNIKVLLREAAVAGSQVTRGMINTQMDYPQTDPIIAVSNPQPDGYGGSCTIALFTFDILDILGVNGLLQSLEDMVGILDAIAALSLDDLFSAACQVFNHIFGDLQAELISAIQDNNPLTPLQRFLNKLAPGFVVPLQTLLDVATHTRPTTATIPGIATGSPLLVSFIPEVGYVYLAQLQSGMVMVVHISPTPLIPEDAV